MAFQKIYILDEITSPCRSRYPTNLAVDFFRHQPIFRFNGLVEGKFSYPETIDFIIEDGGFL